MKLILEEKDILRLVYNAFVDGGLIELKWCDVHMRFFDRDYESCRKSLRENQKEICLEDVYLEMFKQGKVCFIDENQNGKKIPFTLEKVRKNLEESLDTENFYRYNTIMESLYDEGNADASTHFTILQLMLFGDIIYG